MAKSPGKCIFCQGYHLSKEHIFSGWLREFFPRDETATHEFGTFVWPNKIITKGPARDVSKRLGHVGSRKVRVVCKSCNSGWLSVLENQTKPVLTPLIVGEHANLTPEAQTLLATWVSKTVMTAEFVRPKKRCISQIERTCLKDRLTPPANWCIWIAAYNGTNWRDLAIYQHRGYLHESPIPKPGDDARHIQSTFIGIGHIVFLVVNSAGDEIHSTFEKVEETTGLIQIWPTQARSVLWPTIRVLDDPQASSAAEILSDSGAFLTPPHRRTNRTFTF